MNYMLLLVGMGIVVVAFNVGYAMGRIIEGRTRDREDEYRRLVK